MPSVNTKTDGKVNKGMPVFFREKNCIENPPPFFTRVIKYCIFRSKIQN